MTAQARNHCAHLRHLPHHAPPTASTARTGREVLRGPFGGLRALRGPRGRLVAEVIALVVGGTGAAWGR